MKDDKEAIEYEQIAPQTILSRLKQYCHCSGNISCGNKTTEWKNKQIKPRHQATDIMISPYCILPKTMT